MYRSARLHRLRGNDRAGRAHAAACSFHAAMGRLILEHEATLERFTGDGMMVFFNDPVRSPTRPSGRAHAIAMRDRIQALSGRSAGSISLGIGIAQGYATIGAIGFEGRIDYGAIGTVTNLAARLCGEAKGGQILHQSKNSQRDRARRRGRSRGSAQPQRFCPSGGDFRQNEAQSQRTDTGATTHELTPSRSRPSSLHFLNEFFRGSGYCHSARGRSAA